MRKLTLDQKWGARDALLSSAIYGFGFITTKFALEAWSPMTATFSRLFFAAVGGVLLLAITKKLSTLSGHWKISIVSGFVFAAELFTISLVLVDNTVSGGVFMANTYVVLVPFFIGFNPLSLNGLRHITFVGFALLGVALVSGSVAFSLTNQGDLLCLLTSVVTAGHIVTVQRASAKITSPLAFNICQCIWGSAFLALGMLIFESGNPFAGGTPLVWAGILSAALLSTLLATMLQVRAQMRIGAAPSSLLFLMDAPFATALGMILLDEAFTMYQLIGAAIILATSLGQFYFDWKAARNALKRIEAIAPPDSKNFDDVA